MSERRILMVGTGLGAHGGITSVVRSYKDYGMFDAWGVQYIATFEAPGLLTQLRVFGRAFARIFCLLLQGKVALVHLHSSSRGSFWRKSLVAGLAALFRVPYVFHLHSGEFPDFYAKECGVAGRAWVRWILRHAARVVVLTAHWQAMIAAIEPRAVLSLVGNPVHVPQQLPPAREARRNVLFLGRLQPKKGIFDLLRAIPLVCSKMPHARFILAGDGESAAVRALAEELGVSGAIELTGWVDGAAKQRLLEQADVFVLPSYFEALPVGLLEAMSCGIPIVSTAVGGIPDFIRDRREGLLVQPGLTKALADALVCALDDQALRQHMREQAFSRVEREYSFPAVLHQLGSIYRDLGVAVAELPAH